MAFLPPITIPQSYQRTESVYRSFRHRSELNYQLGCGFIHGKRSGEETIRFEWYGILIVLAGRGEYADKNTARREVGPGDVIQRLPGVPHISPVLESNEKWLECFIVFGTPLFNTLADLGILDRNRPILHPGIDLTLVSRFATLQNDLRAADQDALPHLLTRAQGIINTIYALDRNGQRKSANSTLVSQACGLLTASLEDRSSTRNLLAHLPLSYERLRKRFREEMGISPGHYRLASRLDHARELLTATTLPIKAIALQLGYPDGYDFSRQFSKHTGISPTAFRQQR